ncbi:MAG: hypothetical protein ACRC7R_01890 [Sarcina sp.]
MREEIIQLLNQYRETKIAIENFIPILEEKDYAQGKLDLVKTIISDLEKIAKEV